MQYARVFFAVAASFCGAHMHQCARSSDDESSPTINELLQRAQIIRREMCGESMPSFLFDYEQLAYPHSIYEMKLHEGKHLNKKSSVKRGFCNWLIPQKIMIGQYPGMTPEMNGPSANECQIHIQNMIQKAKINQFCCLQTEVPPQDDDYKWDALGGEVYLEPIYLRREFPRPFTRYGPAAQTFSDSTVRFRHCAIEDLGTPSCNDNLLHLLSALLQHLESDVNNTLYLHCWGGRGRAGLIGGLCGSLFFPELTSQQILEWVQGGYDTRAGAQAMHQALRRSPQTEEQREFVREFVTLVKNVGI